MNNITDDTLLIFDNKRGLGSYVELSSGSAIYPGQGSITGIAYVALKLNGELAELAEATAKEDCIKECGDVLWYVGAMHRELGNKMVDQENMDQMFADYGIPAINPDMIALIACGKLGEIVGKAMRDEDGAITLSAKAMINQYLGSILVCVAQYLNILDVKMSDCMMTNLEKLRDRTVRGVLQGSGDNR